MNKLELDAIAKMENKKASLGSKVTKRLSITHSSFQKILKRKLFIFVFSTRRSLLALHRLSIRLGFAIRRWGTAGAVARVQTAHHSTNKKRRSYAQPEIEHWLTTRIRGLSAAKESGPITLDVLRNVAWRRHYSKANPTWTG